MIRRRLRLEIAAIGVLALSCGGLSGERRSEPDRSADDEYRPAMGTESDAPRPGGAPAGDGSPPGSAPASSSEPEPTAGLIVVGLPPLNPPSPDGTCEQPSIRCNGATLELCTPESGGYLALEVCASSCLCQQSFFMMQCLPPTCAVGEHSCFGPILQGCNECRDGFEIVEVCESREACDPAAGRCITEVSVDAGAP